jgi:predicted acylesterase/phospholipase RssA
MLASAAIPGVFPSVLISVEQDGKAFDEMHVDGGVASQVFIFPAQFDARSLDRRLGRSPTRRLFVIRNGRLNPEWETVEPRLLKIAGRSISSLPAGSTVRKNTSWRRYAGATFSSSAEGS